MPESNKHFPEFLSGGGEMGERIRNFDWESTPLGPPESWEQSLRTCVRIMLSSSQPIWIGWGPQLIKLYNDPYKTIVGGKHPEALGQPASIVWSDIWTDIEPMLKKVMLEDSGTYVENQLLIMERNQYPEETYYTFSYTPIPGDQGGTAGMICFNTDDTSRIVNQRALQVLQNLGKLSFRDTDPLEIYGKAADILRSNTKDFPFALFYEVNEKHKIARAVAWAGEREHYSALPDQVEIDVTSSSNITAAILTGEVVLAQNNGAGKLPHGFWDIAPREFLYIPIRIANHRLPAAILTVGLNPYRKYDREYQQFIRLLSDQLSLILNNMHALHEERMRSEALAKIDESKTLFFNNISHEFRTPLTLILGPLEELMREADSIPARAFQALETTHRNAMRLLKLVNTLLDFSRIESGRHKARFSPVQLEELTSNLAGSFRSVMERGQLELEIDIHPIGEPVYIDTDLWEKIIFNLLSNAFKFTLEGKVTVSLKAEGDFAVMKISDTGIGIPEDELPNLFTRFHRVQGAGGRTFEGSGIGLSMIRELVRMHGGSIEVQSTEGAGSTFTVSIPLGSAHLPADQVSDSVDELAAISEIYITEAETFLETPENASRDNPGATRTVLVVDDNQDMRDHIESILSRYFNVVTAPNGHDALEKLELRLPDLILSDIMMPVMDGIELLGRVRDSERYATIPVILLSARAGEEARITGIETGADDYLVKPFSSRELVARIQAQLKVAHARSNSERQIRNLFNQAPAAINIFRGPKHIVELANPKMLELWDKTAEEVMYRPLIEALPELAGQGFDKILDQVLQTGKRVVQPETIVQLMRGGVLTDIFVKVIYEPLTDESGNVVGIMTVADDITESVLARKAIEESQNRLSVALDAGQMGTFDYYPQSDKLVWSAKTCEFFEYPHGSLNFETFASLVHPEDISRASEIVQKALSGFNNGEYENEYRVLLKNGGTRWIRAMGRVTFDSEGHPARFSGITQDISRRKVHEEALCESEERFRTIADQSPMIVFMTDSQGSANITYLNQMWMQFTGLNEQQSMGQGWHTVVHPDDIAKVEVIYRQAHQTRISYILDAVRLKRYDGEYRWHMFKSNPRFSPDGAFLGYLGVATEIHDQKAAADAIRESESRFRMLAEKLPHLVWVTGPDGKQEFISARWKHYTGSPRAGLDSLAEFVHPADMEALTKAWDRSLETGKNMRVDARLRDSQGSYRWHALIGEPVLESGGDITRWVGAFADIHHERTFAQELKQLVEARTNELSSKNEDLEKMNRELESFAYISSHDLQEPLRKIQTFASRIMDREFESLSETGRSYFQRMQDAAFRMQTLIEDLLAYSRTTNEDRKIERADLNAVLDEIREEFGEEILAREAKIESEKLGSAMIIPFQFRQLLHNLFVNSLKFAREGVPARITVSSEVIDGNTDIHPKLIVGKRYTHLQISDNGIGFEPEYGEKIFQVFQRLHGRDKYSGTGIGLAIVKKIIDNHNGHISATGRPGAGATFDIYLPA